MKSKRIFVFLIPTFIAALIYAYIQMPRQERVLPSKDKTVQHSPAKKNSKSSAISKDGFPQLRTDLLERKSQPYSGVRRNLFSSSFYMEQREGEPEAPQEEPVEVIALPVIPMAPPPPPPPTPQDVAQKELTSYKFLGFFKKGDKKTIFLSTSGDEILLVRKGEYLGRDRKFYVVNITDTSLELQKEGAGNFMIKLTDQESLSAVPIQKDTATHQVTKQAVEPPENFSAPEDVQSNEDQPQAEEDNQ